MNVILAMDLSIGWKMLFIVMWQMALLLLEQLYLTLKLRLTPLMLASICQKNLLN